MPFTPTLGFLLFNENLPHAFKKVLTMTLRHALYSSTDQQRKVQHKVREGKYFLYLKKDNRDEITYH